MNPSCPFAKSLNDWKQEVNQRDVDRRKSAAATIGAVLKRRRNFFDHF